MDSRRATETVRPVAALLLPVVAAALLLAACRARPDDGRDLVDRATPAAADVDVDASSLLPVDPDVAERLQQRTGAVIAPPPPAELVGLLGEYRSDESGREIMLLERQGRLLLLAAADALHELEEVSPADGDGSDDRRSFQLVDLPQARVEIDAGELTFADDSYRRVPFPETTGEIFRIEPMAAISELRERALAASPPLEEPAPVRPPDLVELIDVDPSLRLDIRYAGTRNFMGTEFYLQARAFLQRPAAEALSRAHGDLREQGFGLLIYDAYRPWHVTKMFWDATPDFQREFVADPSQGSRHNRGCAVDLTLVDLQTGEPVPMPSGYDEFSRRAYSDYPAWTTRQRDLRALLRQELEEEGFQALPNEWWHFDFAIWRDYPILDVRFEDL